MRLGVRLVLAFIFVSIIPLAFMVIGGLRQIIQLNHLVINESSEQIKRFIHDLIRQKTLDVSMQMEALIDSHPELLDIYKMQQSQEARHIGIQRVGRIGYTAIGTPDGLIILHPDPAVEGTNLLANPPRELYPEFKKLFEKALTSISAQGYYRWREPDGSVKEKFLASHRTRHGLIVFATAYLEDIYRPLESTKRAVQTQTEIIKSKLTLWGTLAVFIATITGAFMYVSIIRPLSRIRGGIAAFSEGNYSYRIPLSGSTDELNTVAALLNQLAEQLEITMRELKKETEKLADSEARYRALVENMSQPLILVNNKGIVTYTNPAFTRTLGYTSDEAVGKEFSYFVHPDELDTVKRRAGYAILRNRKNFQIQVQARHKQGYFVMLDINATLVYSRDKKWAYTVVLGQDITETHKIHRELETANLVLNQLKTGIALFTPDGNIVFANQHWADVHGYSDLYEFQYKPWSVFFPAREAETVERCFISALNGTAVFAELSHLRRNGTEVVALTTFSPLRDTQGELIGVICSTCDITEYRQKLQELQRKIDILEQRLNEINAELERALMQVKTTDRLKTEFLSSISHELRTPLNAIVGFSRYLLEKAPPQLLDKHGVELEHIYQNSLYLHELIASVLELQNIDSGDVMLDPTEFSLTELIKEVLDTIKNIYYTKHLQIKNRTAQEDIRIYADRAKVRRILFSLLSNAVKFTQAGEIVISAHQNQKQTTVEIMDTGIGIPESEREKIFERFVQLSEPVPGQFFGTGLGLTLAKAYVELHGGEIDFRPNPEEGVTFWFTIPKLEQDQS